MSPRAVETKLVQVTFAATVHVVARTGQGGYQARGFSRCGRCPGQCCRVGQLPGTLVQGGFLNVPVSVVECKVMAVAFGIVDRTRISHDLTGRLSDRLQAAETLSIIPRPNERVSRAPILLIIWLSSFDPVKNKWFARWPFL